MEGAKEEGKTPIPKPFSSKAMAMAHGKIKKRFQLFVQFQVMTDIFLFSMKWE